MNNGPRDNLHHFGPLIFLDDDAVDELKVMELFCVATMLEDELALQ